MAVRQEVQQRQRPKPNQTGPCIEGGRDGSDACDGAPPRLDLRNALFERFTLGDSTTLRGWDKYEIAPAGGNRVIHSSIEYRYTGLALFLDIGSVWDANTERQVRVSTGFGFHGGPAFFVVGFPLNTDNLTAIVMMGLRIPGVGIRW